jgi:hypothetical protein
VVDCLFGFGFSPTAAVRPGLSGSEGRAGTPAVLGGGKCRLGFGGDRDSPLTGGGL